MIIEFAAIVKQWKMLLECSFYSKHSVKDDNINSFNKNSYIMI